MRGVTSLESNRWLDRVTLIVPALIAPVCAWLTLGGVTWNLHVPLNFWGDATFYLAQSKSTLDHGWSWFNPSIGAPLGVHALAFAQNTNVDQAIVWFVGLFTDQVGLAVNVTWLAMLGLGALTATWGLRRLGVSRVGAGAAGVLFALCPFALYRNIGHFNMVTYLVPFPVTAAILLASTGREGGWRWRDWAAPVAGCALVGFNYIYFAFFGAFIVAVGALAGAVRIRSIAPLKVGAMCFGALVLATTLNLIPNALVWQQHGEPGSVQHRPVESEIYGLKIRHLISPSQSHWFPPYKAWLDRERDAGFPYENENVSARIGTVASAGFFVLIAAFIFPSAAARDEGDTRLQAAAAVAMALVLLATMGGFGTLFNLFVSPAIRAYNRIAPFVAFVSLAGIALWVDRVTRARPARLRAGVWLALLVFGVFDQQSALRGLVNIIPSVEREIGTVSSFVARLESQLPDQAMVFQLPVRPYPVDSTIERLGAYDQFMPYLASHRLRWSYPALSRDQLIWERALESVAEADLPRHLAREGFSAILISRAGYADGGRRLEQVFQDAPGGATILESTDRFVALDLRRLRPGPDPR